MRLLGYWRSSASWRVRIALHLKGLPFTHEPVHLVRDGGEQHSEAYRALNPMAQVPTLVVDAGGEEVALTQSLAIMEWLEEAHPEPPILPAQPFERARVRQIAEIVNSGIQPMQNLSTLLAVEALGAERAAWAKPRIARGLEAVERLLGTGPFALEARPTIADACIVPQLYAAGRFGVDLQPFSKLMRVDEACAAHPAFQAAHADAQPDAQRT